MIFGGAKDDAKVHLCGNCDRDKIADNLNLKIDGQSSTFCRKCGKKQSIFVDWSNLCKDCEAKIVSGDTYCWNCGKGLR